MRCFLSGVKGALVRDFTVAAYSRTGKKVTIQTDASPYGIGAVLYVEGQAAEYLYDRIREQDEVQLGYKAGANLGQQAWEALAILAAVREWRSVWRHGRIALAIRSDNVGALTAVAKLTAGSPAMGLCARELALEVAEGSFAPDILEHISGVSNVIPDHLSRSFDPKLHNTWQLPDSLRGRRSEGRQRSGSRLVAYSRQHVRVSSIGVGSGT